MNWLVNYVYEIMLNSQMLTLKQINNFLENSPLKFKSAHEGYLSKCVPHKKLHLSNWEQFAKWIATTVMVLRKKQ